MTTTTTIPLGQRLREWRETNGLTIEETARMADVARLYVPMIECGTTVAQSGVIARIEALIATPNPNHEQIIDSAVAAIRAGLEQGCTVVQIVRCATPVSGRVVVTIGEDIDLEEMPHMNNERPTIVCLCGSTRFFTAFQKANYDETMAGKIVLSVGFYPHSQDQAHGEQVGCTPEQKEALDQLHMRKIDLADEVLVLNCDGYIGDSTKREVAYAQQTGKPVRWLEDTE